MKDVPFFPYAPYLPQTEMSVTSASFSQKHVQLPPVAEEEGQEEDEERVEDNERVQPSLLVVHQTPVIFCACTAVDCMLHNQSKINCLPTLYHLV